MFHLAAPCPDWLKRAWIEWLGPEKVWELYAGTEAQAVTVIKGDEWLEHPGSVGRPIVGEMKILDPDGNELPPGEQGEVFMRPPEGVTTYRYIGAEAKALDGWESLGDMGWMDEDGYLYLGDRTADMILAGGANIYPAEIEAALDAHPAVGSSCVIGLPDDDLGNRDPRDRAGDRRRSPTTSCAPTSPTASSATRSRARSSTSTEPLRDDAGKIRRSALRAERLRLKLQPIQSPNCRYRQRTPPSMGVRPMGRALARDREDEGGRRRGGRGLGHRHRGRGRGGEHAAPSRRVEDPGSTTHHDDGRGRRRDHHDHDRRGRAGAGRRTPTTTTHRARRRPRPAPPARRARPTASTCRGSRTRRRPGRATAPRCRPPPTTTR